MNSGSVQGARWLRHLKPVLAMGTNRAYGTVWELMRRARKKFVLLPYAYAKW